MIFKNLTRFRNMQYIFRNHARLINLFNVFQQTKHRSKKHPMQTKPIFRNQGLQSKTFSKLMQEFQLQNKTHIQKSGFANKNIFRNHASILSTHFRKQNQCILANKPHIQKSSFTKKNIFRNHAKHFSNAFRKTKPMEKSGFANKNIFSKKKQKPIKYVVGSVDASASGWQVHVDG